MRLLSAALVAALVALVGAATPAEGTAPVRIVFTADTGMNPEVFTGMGKATPTLAIIAGDLSYQVGSEQAYCDLVNGAITAPVAMLPGNHEGLDPQAGGGSNFAAYAACLPDRAGAKPLYGGFPTDYLIDLPNVRLILISPNIATGNPGCPNGKCSYANGTPEQAALLTAIADAKKARKWVVVVQHEPSFGYTIGNHATDVWGTASPDLAAAEIKAGVAVVVSGHDHNYARSKPQGVTTFVTVGNGGYYPKPIGSLGTMWASGSGTNSPGGIDIGYLQLDISTLKIAASEVSVLGPHAGQVFDRFTVKGPVRSTLASVPAFSTSLEGHTAVPTTTSR